jgi:hypothetical protein
MDKPPVYPLCGTTIAMYYWYAIAPAAQSSTDLKGK